MIEMYDFGPEISHKLMNLTDIFKLSSFYNILVNNVPFCAVYTNFGASGMPRHVHIPPKIRVLNHNSVKNGQIELKLSSNVHYTILK